MMAVVCSLSDGGSSKDKQVLWGHNSLISKNGKLSQQRFWPWHEIGLTSRRFKRYPIAHMLVSSWLPFTVD